MHVVEPQSQACLVGGVAVAAAGMLPSSLEAVLRVAGSFAGADAVVVVVVADPVPVVGLPLALARRPPCPRQLRASPRRLQSNK